MVIRPNMGRLLDRVVQETKESFHFGKRARPANSSQVPIKYTKDSKYIGCFSEAAGSAPGIAAPGQSGLATRTFCRQDEQAHNVYGVLRSDRQGRLAKNGVANIFVKAPVIAAQRGHAPLRGNASIIHSGERSPVLLRIDTPIGASGRVARAQESLLRVHSSFHKAAFRPQKNVMRPRNKSQHRCMQDGAEAIRVVQQDVEGVIGKTMVALGANISFHKLRRSKEKQSLIDQMRPEVEENAAPRTWLLAPGPRAKLRAVAVVVALVAHQTAQLPACHDLPHGLESAIPSTILIHSDQPPEFFGKRDERFGFLKSCGERLVHHDVASGFQGLPGVREMGVIGRGDDDEFNRSYGE